MITNKLNLPQPFLDAVTSNYKYKEKRYSVTSLLKGTCQTILERRHQDEIEQDVADMVWLIFGSAVHKILEEGKETNDQLKENWFSIKVGDYELSGIFDLYDDKTKTVTDYKTASVWKVTFDDWEDYRQQLLIYAYMLRKIGFDCENGEIVALLKDHSKTKAKVDYSYPQYPVHKKSFHFTQKDFEEIEKFLIEKFKEISVFEQMKDEELTPCTEQERWQDPTKYAVKKKGNKRALKLYDNEEEARQHCSCVDGLEIEVRPSEPKKCNEYCSVSAFCPFYQKYLKEKELINE